LISVIVPSFNKEENIIKSIRSIQNQSFKNIEIIIVDDCSSLKSIMIYKTLLKSDPRIRLFIHFKNMGVWRARLDGFLYSRGKYVITLDPDDLYEDNYVLEDLYNIMEKYQLDSVKMLFRLFDDYNKIDQSRLPFDINYKFTEIVDNKKISEYNSKNLNWGFGVIWNRLTRSDILTKSLYSLSDNVLNAYKNYCDDQWWNRLADKYSKNFLIIKRFGYLYYQAKDGLRIVKMGTDEEKNKMIQEFVTSLYFDYDFLPKNDNKKSIIKKLKRYDKYNIRIKLSKFKTNFYILNNLLKMLLNDPYVTKDDKEYVNQLLIDSYKRQKKK
jgi:glycosyltransferase involved in cell wall biosynthesis